MDPYTLDLQFDDNASISSGSSQSFDLDAWKAAFKPLHAELSKKMYFL